MMSENFNVCSKTTSSYSTEPNEKFTKKLNKQNWWAWKSNTEMFQA